MGPLLAACFLSVASAVPLRAVWDRDSQRGAIPGVDLSRAPEHHNCSLAVVGGGWGGAYLAWRLGVDAGVVDPATICVFEANGRVGGRIYSVRDLPSLEGLSLDVGGYRFIETDKILTDLIWKALKLPTRCYDTNCTKSCPGGAEGYHTCHVLEDAYSNNAGYALPIETMLGQLMDEGATVRFARRLVKLEAAGAAEALAFEDGSTAAADTVVLNMPRNALARVDGDWLPAAAEVAVLDEIRMVNLTKVYASYEDAWWANHLGMIEGFFNNSMDGSVAPLHGRYHDGPIKCLVGHDDSGRPVYSGERQTFGNCSGALEVYYTVTHPYYAEFKAASKEEPLSVYEGGRAVDELHASLMDFHKDALAAAGVDVAAIAKPQLVAVADWTFDAQTTPACGDFLGGERAMKKARRPDPARAVFLANQDFGPHFCWATGSLITAERVLMDLAVPPPTWLNASWYAARVASLP